METGLESTEKLIERHQPQKMVCTNPPAENFPVTGIST